MSNPDAAGPDLLVAGSIALDTLEGPFGTVHEELGGSALYFALAASLIMPVRIIAPVGTETVDQMLAVIGDRPIDASLVEVLEAPTYRWRAWQDPGRNVDQGSKDSIYDLWQPKTPAGFDGWAFVGSVRPDRQAQLMRGLSGARMLAGDAMLSYVRSRTPEARDVLSLARWYFCNNEEFGALGGDDAEQFRRAWSLEGLVVKAGSRGVTAYTAGGSFHVPALVERPVVDTTGGGDAIAAGMLAHWLNTGAGSVDIKEALVWGVACASITISAIGLRAIAAATRDDLDARVKEVRECLLRES